MIEPTISIKSETKHVVTVKLSYGDITSLICRQYKECEDCILATGSEHVCIGKETLIEKVEAGEILLEIEHQRGKNTYE